MKVIKFDYKNKICFEIPREESSLFHYNPSLNFLFNPTKYLDRYRKIIDEKIGLDSQILLLREIFQHQDFELVEGGEEEVYVFLKELSEEVLIFEEDLEYYLKRSNFKYLENTFAKYLSSFYLKKYEKVEEQIYLYTFYTKEGKVYLPQNYYPIDVNFLNQRKRKLTNIEDLKTNLFGVEKQYVSFDDLEEYITNKFLERDS